MGAKRPRTSDARTADADGERRASQPDRSPRDPAEWLRPVAESIARDGGLTEIAFPQRLAQGVVTQAEGGNLSVTDTVDALAKIQAMALKVKAAAFLKKSGQDDIQALRDYAQQMINGSVEGES